MNRPRLIRGIEITWTVCCSIACVLLIVLWVRSYWVVEQRYGPSFGSWTLVSVSLPGVLCFGVTDTPYKPIRRDAAEWWTWASKTDDAGHPPYRSKVLGYFNCGNGRIDIPYWLAVMLMIAGAVAPRKSFSLRTLLIATTLVAVVLGTIVWAVQ
jgi:hypothetical protein